MRYEFHLQDPTNPETVYLFEALVEGFAKAKAARGIFAFASRNGVDALLMDETVRAFLSRGTFDLLVGLDAVTNRPTLERLQELQSEHPRLQVRVFWNRTRGLFHPKIAHFQRSDGSHRIIVGSGNLTPGGLRKNYEAYSLMSVKRGEIAKLAAWKTFLDHHSGDIRPIDEEALERASRNIVRGVSRRDVEPDVTAADLPEQGEAEGVEEELTPLDASSQPVLIAQIPKAGGDYGRWNQAHFNKEIMQQFFQAKPNMNQRIFLTGRQADGRWAVERPRPIVYSKANKNLKIELAARKGEKYPAEGPPIAIFRELQVRTFQYVILMPGEPGYDAMLELTETLSSIGKGKRRVLTDLSRVQQAWPTCPLA